MIIGIGTDIVQIPRIEKLLREFGERFIARWFTIEEQEAALRFRENDSKTLAGHFAKRFAAKEACVKALGTGFRNGIRFADISVRNDENGKPEIHLIGTALEHSKTLGENIIFHLSLSDDYPVAMAMVIIESKG